MGSPRGCQLGRATRGGAAQRLVQRPAPSDTHLHCLTQRPTNPPDTLRRRCCPGCPPSPSPHRWSSSFRPSSKPCLWRTPTTTLCRVRRSAALLGCWDAQGRGVAGVLRWRACSCGPACAWRGQGRAMRGPRAAAATTPDRPTTPSHTSPPPHTTPHSRCRLLHRLPGLAGKPGTRGRQHPGAPAGSARRRSVRPDAAPQVAPRGRRPTSPRTATSRRRARPGQLTSCSCSRSGGPQGGRLGGSSHPTCLQVLTPPHTHTHTTPLECYIPDTVLPPPPMPCPDSSRSVPTPLCGPTPLKCLPLLPPPPPFPSTPQRDSPFMHTRRRARRLSNRSPQQQAAVGLPVSLAPTPPPTRHPSPARPPASQPVCR